MSDHNLDPSPDVGGRDGVDSCSCVLDLLSNNVTVDQTPLQLQIKRNKECKYNYEGFKIIHFY